MWRGTLHAFLNKALPALIRRRAHCIAGPAGLRAVALAHRVGENYPRRPGRGRHPTCTTFRASVRRPGAFI